MDLLTMIPGLDAKDMGILLAVAYVLLQARAQFKWLNDGWTIGVAAATAVWMVVFDHTSDWHGKGDFFKVAPIFAVLLGQHAIATFGFLWAAEKGSLSLASAGAPAWLQQVFPKFNARTNGTTPPPAPPATTGGTQ